MKKMVFLLIILCSFVLSSKCCLGYNILKGELDPMTKADWERQATMTILEVVDWGQTRYISEGWHYKSNNEAIMYSESNPILGSHPSKSKVDKYFVTSIIVSAIAVRLMPSKLRHIYQYGAIGVEAAYVFHNYNLDIKVHF